jgi:hypothetical protein
MRELLRKHQLLKKRRKRTKLILLGNILIDFSGMGSQLTKNKK